MTSTTPELCGWDHTPEDDALTLTYTTVPPWTPGRVLAAVRAVPVDPGWGGHDSAPWRVSRWLQQVAPTLAQDVDPMDPDELAGALSAAGYPLACCPTAGDYWAAYGLAWVRAELLLCAVEDCDGYEPGQHLADGLHDLAVRLDALFKAATRTGQTQPARAFAELWGTVEGARYAHRPID